MGGLCLAWKLTRPRLTYDRFKLIEANTVWTREIDPDSVLGRGWVTGIVFQTNFFVFCVCVG